MPAGHVVGAFCFAVCGLWSIPGGASLVSRAIYAKPLLFGFTRKRSLQDLQGPFRPVSNTEGVSN